MNATDVRPDAAGAGQGRGPAGDRRPAVPRRDGDHRRRHRAAGRLRPDRPSAHAPRRARRHRPDRRPDPGQGGRRRWPAGCSPSTANRKVDRAHRRRLPRRGRSCSAKAADVDAVVVGKTRPATSAITRFQVRRSLLDPIGYEILAEVVERLRRAGRVPARDRPGRRRRSTSSRSSSSRAARGRKVIEKTSADGGTAHRPARPGRRPAGRQPGLGHPAPPRAAAGDARDRRQPVPRKGARGEPAGPS